MFMLFSWTKTYQWIACTSSSSVIYWCWHIFVCKMLLSLLIDVYVIFFDWNISMNCTYFMLINHLLMLTYFCVENVPEFQYCFWLFTDIDNFHVQNVLNILNWCLCYFLWLKHINELHSLHNHGSFTDADIFLCFISNFHLKNLFKRFIKQWL